MNEPVELHNHLHELRNFYIRLAICVFFVLLLFSILFGRFYYLQVIRSEHYTTLAEANRIHILPLTPNRGLIFDRNGIVLAQNYTAYTLEIVPDQVDDLDAIISQLATLIDITPEDHNRFKKLKRENTRFKSIPIRSRLTDIEVARFAENRFRFPGVEVKARLLRHYPEGESISHFIGYINRINDMDLKQLGENNQMDNYRGGLHI